MKSVFNFDRQGVLNKGPKVWPDGARPPPIMSNYEFVKVLS